MPVDRLEVRVSITKLLLTLTIVIVPMSIIGLILTQHGDKALDSAIGNDFKSMAQVYSDDVSQFMTDRIAEVKTMAADPRLVAAVANANRSTSRTAQPDSNVTGTNNGAGNAAQTGSSGSAGALLTSAPSQALRLRKDLDPRFLNIVATDQSGRVVAASQRPTMTSYAQDELWQAAYNDGSVNGKISNIIYNDFTKSYYVNINIPIVSLSSNQPIGVLSAAVNLTGMLTRFQAPVGNGARAVLVNDDGLIVSAPNTDVFARAKSQDFDAVRDSLGSAQAHKGGWQLASTSNGPSLVGFAATGLKQNYPNLGWVVMVTQPEHAAAASIRGLEQFAVMMVILALFMLTLLCVYYFLHRSQRLEDIEDVLPSRSTRAASASA